MVDMTNTTNTSTRTRKAIETDIREALSAAYGHLASKGGTLHRSAYKVLQPGESSAKLAKNADETWSAAMPQYKVWLNRTTGAIVHDVPADLENWSYLGNVCPNGQTCYRSCIGEAGRYGMGAKNARTWVRALNTCAPELLDEMIRFELDKLNTRAIREGIEIAVRLNVISDVRWERRINLASFGAIKFYDYTKWNIDQRDTSIANYSITSSGFVGRTLDEMIAMVRAGQNVAVVVPTAEDAESPTFAGLPAINGDKDDARYNDPRGVFVLLRVKFTGTDGHESIYAEGMVRDVTTGAIISTAVKVSRAPRKVTAEQFAVTA